MYLATNPNTGEHIYTTSIAEYKEIKENGWRQDGVQFYVVFSS
jgi:hypothetical protein